MLARLQRIEAAAKEMLHCIDHAPARFSEPVEALRAVLAEKG